MQWIDHKGQSWVTGEQPVRSGGQGEVFQTRDGRHAIKAARPGHEDFLRREIAALLSLVQEQPGLEDSLVVPRAHGERPRPFLVLDWYEQDAAGWLKAQARSLEERLSLAEACCRAVVALHWSDGERVRNMTWRFEGGGEQAGRVVHRDIKPGNFLLREGPEGLEARLIDFGAVRTADARTVTMATQIYTEGFAPLEQMVPRRVVPEVSWDVYALGATVFFILCGSLPLGCLGAEGALTPAGRDLQRLHRQLQGRPGVRSLEVQRDGLAGRSLSELIDFSALRPLLAEDEEELRGLLGPAAEELLRDLRRALAARPQERMTDARDLLQRVLALKGRLPDGRPAPVPVLGTVTPVRVAPPSAPRNLAGGGPGTVAAAVPSGTPPELPTVRPVGEVPARRSAGSPVSQAVARPSVRLMALGGVGMVGLVGVVGVAGLGAVGVWWMGERREFVGEVAGDVEAASPSAPAPNAIPMVRIAPGSFTMGCTAGQGDECEDDESPVSVTLTRAFWLGVTEVTQAQWQAVMGRNPSHQSCVECPVENVSWLDAVAFANALSQQEGLEACYGIAGPTVTWARGLDCTGYRLPTEAEWEYAARAGKDTRYAGGNDLAAVGWYEDNSDQKTHPVRGRSANAWGLYDMSGNVGEWTWDRYRERYTGGTDPMGASDGLDRVRRGGGGDRSAREVRLASRDWLPFGFTYSYLGLRLARSIP